MWKTILLECAIGHIENSGWIIALCFSERKILVTLTRLPNGRKIIFFVDNFASNSLTPELVESVSHSSTEIRVFIDNSTDLLEPAD